MANPDPEPGHPAPAMPDSLRQAGGCSCWVQTKQKWLPPSRSWIEREGRQGLRREAAGGDQLRGLSVEGTPA